MIAEIGAADKPSTTDYFAWALKYGQKAPANPWGAKGLEWQTPSPPPTFNFDVTPVVTEEAYAYPDGAGKEPEAQLV